MFLDSARPGKLVATFYNIDDGFPSGLRISFMPTLRQSLLIQNVLTNTSQLFLIQCIRLKSISSDLSLGLSFTLC